MANINFGLNILPKENNTYTLGNSNYKWNIFANQINGTNVSNFLTTHTDIQINGTSIISNGTANIPLADSNTLGVVKVRNGTDGVKIDSNNYLSIEPASDYYLQTGANNYKVLTPYTQHIAIYYGLAKLAGTDLANETVTVGTYPSTTKAAIKTMLGITDVDIQINSTSILSNGTANIPIANTSNLGVVKIGNNTSGIAINNGELRTSPAATSNIKAGNATLMPIVPAHQHEAIYYGLSKLAGVDLASGNSTVGVYSAASKIAIQNMLGIENAVTFSENVSGTTVTITGEPNTKYKCGEVTVLTINAPSAGTIDVWFTSGQIPTSLTVTNAEFPEWFDSENLEANTVYEIVITDGFGGVALWPAPIIT